jgi:DNA polymerase-3 subunit epsilon
MLRHLRLRRPLTFFDVETTGVDPRRYRIVEIALTKLAPGVQPRTLELRFNPERPIPSAASAMDDIRNEHVAQCPTFAERAKRVASFLDGSDLAGFGVARFDLSILVAEFEEIGWMFPLSGRAHTHAHSAGHDVMASVAVLDAMLGKHKDVPRAVEDLHDQLINVEGWFRREGAVVHFTRGMHRDVTLEDVAHRDTAYLTWQSSRVLTDARRLIETALSRGAD